VAKIADDPETGDLVVDAEDTLGLKKRRVNVDMVVLASGMAASLEDGKPEGCMRFDGDHFVVPDEAASGIFVAGCARGPVDVATSVQDATAAAMKAISAIHGAAGA
jgi:quinone-modifying oxidoreductase subunit QmoA